MSDQINPFEQAPLAAPQYVPQPFIPDPHKTQHLAGNIDRNSMTDATKNLYKTQTAAERIMEFYGLIPYNPKDPNLPHNCNNVAAWDRLRVWSSDIYTQVINPYNGNMEKHLWIPKDQQRGVLRMRCEAYWMNIVENDRSMLIKIVPNSPSQNKPKENPYNWFGMPKNQFLDPNANNAVILTQNNQPEGSKLSDGAVATVAVTETAGTTDQAASANENTSSTGPQQDWSWGIVEAQAWSVATTETTGTPNDTSWSVQPIQQWQQWQQPVEAAKYQLLVTAEDDLELIQDQYNKIVTPITGKALPTNRYGKDKEWLIEKISEAISEYDRQQAELKALETQSAT